MLNLHKTRVICAPNCLFYNLCASFVIMKDDVMLEAHREFPGYLDSLMEG